MKISKIICKLFGHKYITHMISYKCGVDEFEILCLRCDKLK